MLIGSPHPLDLYEVCCQHPRTIADALHSLHAGSPAVLHEDFCGSAAVSREWCGVPGRRAVATDTSDDTLRYAQSRSGGLDIRFLLGSVLRVPPATPDADVIFSGNFSVGELRTRSELLAYLARCRARLRPGGIFVCDLFGAQPRTGGGTTRRVLQLPGGRSLEYVWEQRAWDAWAARVRCVIHFRVIDAGEVVASYPDAFVYDWRVWGVAEMSDALREACFESVEVTDPFAHNGAPAGDARAVLMRAM